MITLRKGSKAYIDSFTGLVPCEVLRIYQNDIEHKTCEVLVTNQRGSTSYKTGDVVSRSALFVVPREAVVIRRGGVDIMPYDVELTNETNA